jgi:hypothetical protein
MSKVKTAVLPKSSESGTGKICCTLTAVHDVCEGEEGAGGEEPDDRQHEGRDPGDEAQPGTRGHCRPAPGR